MFNKNTDPIVVVVKNGRFDCFGPDNLRSHYLKNWLFKLGGINESVEEGTYHFNVVRKGFRHHASLTRIN